MNPLTNVRNITKLNDNDLKNGIFDHNLSWHSQYKDSAYIFVGGLPYDLTEGDVLCVFSQYGEIININLVRDKKTGKSQGYCFICYEDQRSTILSVDNLNAIKLDGRTIRVDHVAEYKTPKSDEKGEDGKYKEKVETGCAPQLLPPPQADHEDTAKLKKKKKKKEKKKKEKKEKKKKKNKTEVASCDDDHSSGEELNNKAVQTANRKVDENNTTKKNVASQWDRRSESCKSANSNTRGDSSPLRKRRRSPSSSREKSPACTKNRRRSRSSSYERYSRQ